MGILSQDIETIDDMHKNPGDWLIYQNNEHIDQGEMGCGGPPIETLNDGKTLAGTITELHST